MASTSQPNSVGVRLISTAFGQRRHRWRRAIGVKRFPAEGVPKYGLHGLPRPPPDRTYRRELLTRDEAQRIAAIFDQAPEAAAQAASVEEFARVAGPALVAANIDGFDLRGIVRDLTKGTITRRLSIRASHTSTRGDAVRGSRRAANGHDFKSTELDQYYPKCNRASYHCRSAPSSLAFAPAPSVL
jgi:hypothetical protein